jgi:hypothetical protein
MAGASGRHPGRRCPSRHLHLAAVTLTACPPAVGQQFHLGAPDSILLTAGIARPEQPLFPRCPNRFPDRFAQLEPVRFVFWRHAWPSLRPAAWRGLSRSRRSSPRENGHRGPTSMRQRASRAKFNETPTRERRSQANFSETTSWTPSQRIWPTAGQRRAAGPSSMRRDITEVGPCLTEVGPIRSSVSLKLARRGVAALALSH